MLQFVNLFIKTSVLCIMLQFVNLFIKTSVLCILLQFVDLIIASLFEPQEKMTIKAEKKGRKKKKHRKNVIKLINFFGLFLV